MSDQLESFEPAVDPGNPHMPVPLCLDLLLTDEFGFDHVERAECPEATHLLDKIMVAPSPKNARLRQPAAEAEAKKDAQ